MRYFAKDGPSLYIERLERSDHLADEPHYFWMVATADGTVYRIGKNDRSEEYQSVSQESHLKVGDQTCTGDGGIDRSGIAWHVDFMVDVHGNQVDYDYLTRSNGESFHLTKLDIDDPEESHL